MDLYIGWSSQTGNTLDLVKQFRDECSQHQIPITQIQPINQHIIFHPAIWILFLSTTGQGSPPAPMRSFWESVMRKSYKLKGQVYFAVYSLGDSSYGDNFGMAGRKLRQRLKMLGAKQFEQIGLGDDLDQLGFRQVYVKRWRTNVLAYLQLKAKKIEKETPLNHLISLRKPQQEIQFLVQKVEMLSQHEGRKVFWATLAIKSEAQLTNGDIIQIFPHNRQQDIDYVLQKLAGNDKYSTEQVAGQFAQRYNLSCTLNYYFLANQSHPRLYQHLTNPLFQQKIVEFSNDYSEYFNYFTKYRRSLPQFITDFQINSLDIDYCSKYLNEIKGRKYSIARIEGNRIYLLIKLVEQKITANRVYRGLCSHDLLQSVGKLRKGLIQKGQITCQALRKHNIIITLGTGIAPFIWILDSLEKSQLQCTLLYTNSFKDEIFHQRLVKITLNNHHFTQIISCTRQGGLRMIRLIEAEAQRLLNIITKHGVSETRIFYCGPKEIYQFLLELLCKSLELTKAELLKSKLIVYQNW